MPKQPKQETWEDEYSKMIEGMIEGGIFIEDTYFRNRMLPFIRDVVAQEIRRAREEGKKEGQKQTWHRAKEMIWEFWPEVFHPKRDEVIKTIELIEQTLNQ